MDQKLAVAQRKGTAAAILTLIFAIKGTASAFGKSQDTKGPSHLIVCFAFWIETAILFAGVKKKNPTCMKVIKWFNVVKCLIIVTCVILVLTVDDIIVMEGIDIDDDYKTIYKIVAVVSCLLFLALAICVGLVAHRLDKLYEELLLVRQETSLNSGLVYEGHHPTPPTNQGLPLAPAGQQLE